MGRSSSSALNAEVSAPVPAPPASDLLARAVEAMDGLQSVAMTETLRGRDDGLAVIANYRFASPNAFESQVNDGHQIVIGDQRFRRDPASGGWKTGLWGFDYRWPGGQYRGFWKGAAAVRLGTATVDGVPTRIVGFVRPDLPAWFRLYVDDAGLVRRQEMRAAGHLMVTTTAISARLARFVPPGELARSTLASAQPEFGALAAWLASTHQIAERGWSNPVGPTQPFADPPPVG